MRRKLVKYNELGNYPNVLQPGTDGYEKVKGAWNNFFGNDGDVVLELACGRGEYTVGLAEIFPHKNFIGIDVKGDRLWMASVTAQEKNLTNAAFLRTKIEELEHFFDPKEVTEIWIIFPDPRPKGRDERRRLSSTRFLDTYKKVIKQGGLIHLKTDNSDLFNYSLEVLESRNDVIIRAQTQDVYNDDLLADHYGIQTRYEKKHSALGETIKYLRFSFL